MTLTFNVSNDALLIYPYLTVWLNICYNLLQKYYIWMLEFATNGLTQYALHISYEITSNTLHNFNGQMFRPFHFPYLLRTRVLFLFLSVHESSFEIYIMITKSNWPSFMHVIFRIIWPIHFSNEQNMIIRYPTFNWHR